MAIAASALLTGVTEWVSGRFVMSEEEYERALETVVAKEFAAAAAVDEGVRDGEEVFYKYLP